MAYLPDSNVFITAKNLHYGMDFCPAFWDWILDGHRQGKLFTMEKVKDELHEGEDDLSQWVSKLGEAFFVKVDSASLPAMAEVASWVNGHSKYSAAAKSTFLQIADYYLVAQALANKHIVVTHERPKDSVHRVLIPNVCLGVNAEYMTPFEMLRRERARFVLQRA